MDRLIDNSMKLGFGMMRLPRVEGTNDIDLEHTKRMVDAFIAAGRGRRNIRIINIKTN
jgi:Predicted oxidoreductases of the aldo/keto reductase family